MVASKDIEKIPVKMVLALTRGGVGKGSAQNLVRIQDGE
jgi:hypothetical protein